MNITVAIIQARMHSTRLPGKVIKNICGKPLVCHVIDRIKRVRGINDIIVATTNTQIDDAVEKIVTDYGIKCFRGDEYNVLKRYYDVAVKYSVNNIVRFTCDNPLIDADIISELLVVYNKNNRVYSTMKGFPLGLGAEVFSFELLKETYENAHKDYEKEHVTPYMYLSKKNISILKSNIDYSNYRFTVDTKEDFEFVNEIFNRLYINNNNFGFNDIIELLKKEPSLLMINKNIKQKSIGE